MNPLLLLPFKLVIAPFFPIFIEFSRWGDKGPREVPEKTQESVKRRLLRTETERELDNVVEQNWKSILEEWRRASLVLWSESPQ